MAFKVPEKFRDLTQFSPSDGLNGCFQIIKQKYTLRVIASSGLGWEHVAVSKRYEPPTWDDMCEVKDLFWDQEDCVIQYHPPKSSYVNAHPHVLHLWRPAKEKIPMPDVFMV